MQIQSELNFNKLIIKVENIGDGTHSFDKRRRLIGNQSDFFKGKLKNNKPYVDYNQIGISQYL